MVHDVEYQTLLLYAIFLTCAANYDPRGDDILFHVNWPGPGSMSPEFQFDDPTSGSENIMEMMTPDNERYRCFLPKHAKGKSEQGISDYSGPGAMDLIDPLFSLSSCSYRIESYWTYELCHGKHLRQYHEEKEPGKPIKLQEFFLGKYKLADQTSQEKQATEKPKTVKVEGYEFPYYMVNMTEGTKCDLTNHPRRTTLAYVCQPDGKGEIYEIKEISTCEYQVVVFTRLLCSHPGFKQKTSYVNSIACHSVGVAPKRPKTLDNLELESAQGRYTLPVEQPETGGSTAERPIEQPAAPQEKPEVTLSANSAASKQLLRDFLNGDYCLTGGSGWWRHEFCFSKHVSQYHDSKDGREIIYLGKWDEGVHRMYLENNPEKRPKHNNEKQYVMHYYAGGDLCELTGKQRYVEVKLRCKEDPSRPTAMAIYLMEDSTCTYTLVVESPVLCSLIEAADMDGIFPIPS
ncbi:endoplasmic reticulum lectin 1-like isoform X2 [Lineus longissimus]|uniref:endoplasmic reticulum lectin 1-like isoform X2 n=1 Tax=Lineus longissimus TaxID=88925 RepID=UPI00315DB344